MAVKMVLFRNVLLGFAVAAIALLVATLVAVTVLGQAAEELETFSSARRATTGPAGSGEGSSDPLALADFMRTGQVVTLVCGLTGFLLGLILLVVAANQAARLLKRLKEATRQLANVVVFDEAPHGSTSGSMDDLELEIYKMVRNIQASQKRYLDASPLTRLPGNRAIEQVLEGKMARDERFALCYVDLDDFKVYNDTYGYARGSELIKLTGEIIYRAKDRHADPDDFVGHIGGDDFVLIVASEKAPEVCAAIIAEFDQVIPRYYDQRDRERGFIECRDRYGVLRQFPLMSVSIAVVSDSRRKFNSPMEIARIATEIKDYVKTLPGSNYLIDRRSKSRVKSEDAGPAIMLDGFPEIRG